MSPIMFLALIVVVIIAFVIFTYNNLIKLRNRAEEAWSDIDVQLKRRYNLIPNIVETVKGYAAHEESVFTQVTEARSNAINATSMKEQGAAENMLSGALKSLFAVAENYPELKANENFLQLQNELVDTEDKIQAARRFYNGVVKDFNTKIQQFPNNIIASAFKFEGREFFEIENAEEKEVVKVDFKKDEEQKEEAAPEAPVEPAPSEPAPEAPAPAEPTSETPAEEPKEEPKTEEAVPAPETPAESTPSEPAPEAPAETPTEAPAEEPESEEEEKPAA